jgi:nucleoside-diphosphate-sugar epimerase
MRVVIFGCGYVGEALARAAVVKGWEVWALTRNAAALEALSCISSERRICAELHKDDWHQRLVGEFDIAWNLVSSAGGGLAGYTTSYLEGNRSIARWAASGKLKRFVYSSATSVYPQTEGEWVSETDVPDSETLSPSGRILRMAECTIASSPPAPIVQIFRLGGIYGPGRHLYLDRILAGERFIPGEASGWLNLIHRDDIVHALLASALQSAEEDCHIYNLVDNEPAQKQAIADWLAHTLGKPSPQFDPTATTSRTGRRLIKGKLPNRRIRNERARSELGWNPLYPTFREGYASILNALND